MSIETDKEEPTVKCQVERDCANGWNDCCLNIRIGDCSRPNEKKQRTEFQEFMRHLSNLAWMFFIAALFLSNSSAVILVLLVLAIIFEEFD